MALESGITLYDQIKAKLKGGGVQKDPGFFDFGTINLGPAPEGTFETPDYPAMSADFTPRDMVMEQIQGGLPGEIDYSKGINPVGFYQDVAMDVEMQALTAPGGKAQSTVTRTQAYDDLQAAEMLGLAPPETPADYANLDAIMSNLGYAGSFDYGRSLGPVGSIGFTKTTEAGRQAQGFLSGLMGPLGFAFDALTGDQYVGLGGLQEFDPFGLPGLLTERSQRQVYDIAKMEARGLPGFDAYIGRDGQLKGIRPSGGLAKLFGQQYAVVGGLGTIEEARNELAISKGLDPATYDFATGTGDELSGFVTGFGGFAVDGSFVNMMGERTSSMNHGYRGMQYGSALADVYGEEYASQMMRNQASNLQKSGGFFSQARANYYNGIADQLSAGIREQYTWGTGKSISSGGYVRSTSGQPVRTSTGFAYSGTRYSPAERSANLASFAQSRGFDMNRGRGDPGYGTGSAESEGVSQGGYDPGFDEGDT